MADKIIKYYEKTLFFLICGLVLFPVTPRGVHSTLIITIGALATIYFFIEGIKNWSTSKTIRLFSLGSLFIIYCISLLHLGDFYAGQKFAIRVVPVFLLPFAVLNQKNQQWDVAQFKTILVLYIVASALFLSFLHYTFFEEIHDLQISAWEKRCRIEDMTRVHGTYLSMWTGMAILAVIWIVFQQKTYRIVALLVGTILISYFLFWQNFLAARMPLFATLVAASFLVLTLFKVKPKVIGTLYALIFGVGLSVFWNPIQYKINELSNYEIALPKGDYENTNSNISNEHVRSAIYHCAISNINEKPFLGYGIGNVNRTMQSCYNQKFSHSNLFTLFHFNAHSQYLQLLLVLGIIGLLGFLISIISWIKWASVLLYMPFLILTLLCLVFENVLSRHDGIVFFSVFNTILLLGSSKLDTSSYIKYNNSQ